jgi:3-methylcrotonyl-CoA carboxylase alpha subunit
LRVELGDLRLDATVVATGERRHVFLNGRSYQLARVDPLYHAGEGQGVEGRLVAPMPGRVVAWLATPGGDVEKNTPLLILEAMKMEHTITAPAAGRLVGFRFAVGEQVTEGAELVDFEKRA